MSPLCFTSPTIWLSRSSNAKLVWRANVSNTRRIQPQKQRQPQYSFECVAEERTADSAESFQAIMDRKKQEIEKILEIIAAVDEHPVRKVLESKTGFTQKKKFSKQLALEFTAVPEVRRRVIAPFANPIALKEVYKAAGAKVIAVQTDVSAAALETGDFGIEDLRAISENEGHFGFPVVRCDFLLHPVQLAEAIEAGCQTVILLVPVLGAAGTNALLLYAERLGMEVIAEVRNRNDLSMALDAQASIIGLHLTKQLTPSDASVRAERRKEVLANTPKDVLTIIGAYSESEADEIRKEGASAVFLPDSLLSTEQDFGARVIASSLGRSLVVQAPIAQPKLIVDEL